MDNCIVYIFLLMAEDTDKIISKLVRKKFSVASGLIGGWIPDRNTKLASTRLTLEIRPLSTEKTLSLTHLKACIADIVDNEQIKIFGAVMSTVSETESLSSNIIIGCEVPMKLSSKKIGKLEVIEGGKK